MTEEAATYADMVKKMSNKIDTIGSSKQAEQAKDLRLAVADCLEQDKRRRNIVIFNVSEQDSHSSQETQAEGDLRIFEEIMMTGLKLKLRPEKVSRLGRQRDGKQCLMLVTFHEEGDKWEVLKMAKSLRHAGNKFEKIYIAPDLSPAEQEKNRTLRKELRERKEAGEDVIIHRNRVILRADKRQDRDAYS